MNHHVRSCNVLSVCRTVRTCMEGVSSILRPLGLKVASNKCGLMTAPLGSQK